MIKLCLSSPKWIPAKSGKRFRKYDENVRVLKIDPLLNGGCSKQLHKTKKECKDAKKSGCMWVKCPLSTMSRKQLGRTLTMNTQLMFSTVGKAGMKMFFDGLAWMNKKVEGEEGEP